MIFKEYQLQDAHGMRLPIVSAQKISELDVLIRVRHSQRPKMLQLFTSAIYSRQILIPSNSTTVGSLINRAAGTPMAPDEAIKTVDKECD